MADAWEAADKQVKAAGGDGLFVKLDKDGMAVVGCFLGEPEVKMLFYTGSGYVPYTAEHEKADEQKTPRTTLNFYVPSEKKIKIFEANKTTWASIMALRAEGKYPIDEWFFEIKRSGAKGDPKTTYRIMPETKIDAEHRAIMASLKHHDLKRGSGDGGGDGKTTDMSSHDKKANGAATNGATAAPAVPSDPTVDQETSTGIIQRLKLLPKDKITAFLSEFKIQQVKTLPSKSVPAALAMLDKLEGKPEAPPAAAVEIDPFA